MSYDPPCGSGGQVNASGNMTADGSGFSYAFDAENRMKTANGMSGGPYTYVYDGSGLRVKKSNGTAGTLYWRSLSGDTIAETDLSGNITSEYVFFAGRRIARRDASGNIFFYDADHLGTTRTMTDSSGNICYDADLTPYGQEITVHTNSCPQNYKFTGYERDQETGLDYAMFRYYNPRLGRFMSPDPLGGDVGNPQSLNRYAYVMNNPLTLTDPLGLCGEFTYDTSHAECDGNPGGGGNGGGHGGGGGTGSWEYICVVIPGNDSHPPIRACGLYWIAGRDLLGPQRFGPGGGPGGGPTNNGPVVLKNPCQVQGRALPPSAYAASGQAAKASTIDFILDVLKGWPKGNYLDAQPLASGNVFQNQAYGNYVFGVYMAAAGVPLSTALSGANTYAWEQKLFNPKQYSNYQMDSNYGSLPAANVTNITNGYNAYVNGTLCHN